MASRVVTAAKTSAGNSIRWTTPRGLFVGPLAKVTMLTASVRMRELAWRARQDRTTIYC
jgi:hypothetical protein